MENKPVKKSLSTHIAVVFILLQLFAIIFFILGNGIFLQIFYQDTRKKELVECYNSMDRLFMDLNEDTDAESFELEFDRIIGGREFSVLVIDSSLQPVAVYGDVDDRTLHRLFSYIFKDDPNYLFRGDSDEEASPEEDSGTSDDDEQKDGPQRPGGLREDTVIETGVDYEVRKSMDPRLDNDYLELVGTFRSGHIVFIRTAMESIRSNVKASNRFIVYLGIIALIFEIVLIIVVTKRVTKPVLELARLSDRMSELDFDAEYTGKDESEIGYLGHRMNKMSRTLQKTIAELKTANNELKVDLEKRQELDAMRSDFISNVSHELKTPIAIIQGYAEGLKESVNEDAQSRDYYCDVIIDESARMNRMVRSLLTLNQLEFGQDVVSMECFDICELVRNYVGTAGILIEQAGAEVEIKGEKSLFVWGDEYKIEEVIMNYFTNALHYVKGEKRVVINVESYGENCRVSVFNTGDPISDEALPNIWTKFYKADKARSRQYGGSGVGLSIVKAIMEYHHKPYGVYNSPQGPTFYFELEAKGTGAV